RSIGEVDRHDSRQGLLEQVAEVGRLEPASHFSTQSAWGHEARQLGAVVDGAQLAFCDQVETACAIFMTEQHNDLARRCATSAVGPVKLRTECLHLGQVEW